MERENEKEVEREDNRDGGEWNAGAGVAEERKEQGQSAKEVAFILV